MQTIQEMLKVNDYVFPCTSQTERGSNSLEAEENLSVLLWVNREFGMQGVQSSQALPPEGPD